jgi:hypothetical protein
LPRAPTGQSRIEARVTDRLDPSDAVEWAAMAVELASSTTMESRRIIASSRATRAASRRLVANIRTQRRARGSPVAAAERITQPRG